MFLLVISSYYCHFILDTDLYMTDMQNIKTDYLNNVLEHRSKTNVT